MSSTDSGNSCSRHQNCCLCLSKEILLPPLPNPFAFQQHEVIAQYYSSIDVKTCMITFVRSYIKEKAFLLCKVLISAIVSPVFMIALINIARIELLSHRKYQNQGICPHKCLKFPKSNQCFMRHCVIKI